MFRAVITRSTVTSRALSPRVVMSARSFADKADPDTPGDIGLTGTTSSGFVVPAPYAYTPKANMFNQPK